jgi:hypothetical protein
MRPLGSAHGDEKDPPARPPEIATKGLQAGDLPPLRAAPASGVGRYQFIEAVKLSETLRDTLSAKVVLFDTETGRVWRLDITNPDKPVWKLLVEAPK